MTEAGFLIVVIFVLLLGNGFFSGSEIAIISARRSRIEAEAEKGHGGARKVRDLQDRMDDFLATVQIGVTVMGTLAGISGGYLASHTLEPWIRSHDLAGWVQPAVLAGAAVSAAIVYVELILGELVPKAFALRFTEQIAVVVAWPLHFLARVSAAPIWVLTKSTRAVLYLFGLRDPGHRTFTSEEEILHLVREGREQGVLDETEMQIIHSVFDFSETPVKKVMVPRPKVFGLEVGTPPGEVERQMVESGFSRVPVYEGSLDNVVGLVYVKDVIRLMEKRQPVVLRKILHQGVLLVPETKKVGELLKELQKRRTHMAVVLDEHGSLSGLVTLEDLLEEIVGEIQDEYDWEERSVEKLRDGSLVVDGTVAAQELREKHEVPLPPSDEFDTVAGFMLSQLGALPRGGEVVDLGTHRLTVVDVERNRISKVKIERRPDPPRTA